MLQDKKLTWLNTAVTLELRGLYFDFPVFWNVLVSLGIYSWMCDKAVWWLPERVADLENVGAIVYHFVIWRFGYKIFGAQVLELKFMKGGHPSL